jgi:hypothetical protein
MAEAIFAVTLLAGSRVSGSRKGRPYMGNQTDIHSFLFYFYSHSFRMCCIFRCVSRLNHG